MTRSAAPAVQLVALDDDALERLVRIAVEDAEPVDAVPPVPGPPGWTAARVEAFRAYHRSRRSGLGGPHREATYAIVVNGAPVGAGRLAQVRPGTLEMGIWLGRSARSRGIGGAAAALLVAAAQASGAQRVVAETTADNRAALAALERLGAAITPPAADGAIHAELPLPRRPARRPS